jgi:hypothetical protein
MNMAELVAKDNRSPAEGSVIAKPVKVLPAPLLNRISIDPPL